MKRDEEIDWFCNQTDQSHSQKLSVFLSWSLQCVYILCLLALSLIQAIFLLLNIVKTKNQCLHYHSGL